MYSEQNYTLLRLNNRRLTMRIKLLDNKIWEVSEVSFNNNFKHKENNLFIRSRLPCHHRFGPARNGW